jgi:chitinase
VTFTWSAGANVSQYRLSVGTTGVGSTNVYNQWAGSGGTARSATVGGLPTNGATVYARLSSMINSAWQSNDYTFRAAAGTTPTPSPQPPSGGTRRVVGYFAPWARDYGYSENAIDFSVVTHVAHFSVIPLADGSVRFPVEQWGGPFPDPALVNRTHQAGAKVILVVGGDLAAATQGFSAMVADPAARRRFVDNLMALVDQHGYDGVDLDWESPQSAADRSNLNLLVAELRAALGPDRSLSICLPADAGTAQWFDLATLTPQVDWLSAMTYSLHGAAWSAHTGHNAGLYAPTGAAPLHPSGELTVDSARAYYRGRGVPAEKLFIGLPFYGERFDTASAMYQTVRTPSGGSIDYRQVLPLLSGGWQPYRDPEAQVPYLIRAGAPGVVSYDDPMSIEAKCGYAAQEGLGGVIIWHLGKDWANASQPLLRAAGACR